MPNTPKIKVEKALHDLIIIIIKEKTEKTKEINEALKFYNSWKEAKVKVIYCY